MRTTCWAALAAAILLAASCDNSNGIFKTIQDETKQVGTKVFQKTQVKNAFRLGDYYYATTSTLNRRAVASDSWSKVEVDGISKYSVLGPAVLVGDSSTGTIYVLLENGDNRELYSWDGAEGSVWTQVSLPTGTSFDRLYAAGPSLFAENHVYDSTAETSSYSLYLLSGSAFAAVSNFAPATDKTIRGVIYESGASPAPLYWFASENQLYRGTAADGSDAASVIDSFASISDIWDISYTGGVVYVATYSGSLYRGSDYATNAIASLPLTKAIQVPLSASSYQLLAGTDADSDEDTAAVGYYEGVWDSWALGDYDGGVAGHEAVYNTTVSAFPIHDFFYDGDLSSGRLFISVSPGTTSTSYYGLYSSAWDGSSWSDLTAE
jgi:hypothetical protein